MVITFVYSDYLFKLLLIGDSGVGKSCLLLRFAVCNNFYLINLLKLLVQFIIFLFNTFNNKDIFVHFF